MKGRGLSCPCPKLGEVERGFVDLGDFEQDVGRLARQFAHFIGQDGKAAAMVAKAGGFDPGIEGEDAGVGGDLRYRGEHGMRAARQGCALVDDALHRAFVGDVDIGQHGAAPTSGREDDFENLAIVEMVVQRLAFAPLEPDTVVVEDAGDAIARPADGPADLRKIVAQHRADGQIGRLQTEDRADLRVDEADTLVGAVHDHAVAHMRHDGRELLRGIAGGRHAGVRLRRMGRDGIERSHMVRSVGGWERYREDDLYRWATRIGAIRSRWIRGTTFGTF